MALKKCEDCGQMVSPLAESCPKCGRPFVSTKKGNAFNPLHDPVHFIGCALVVLIGVGILAFIIVGLSQ